MRIRVGIAALLVVLAVGFVTSPASAEQLVYVPTGLVAPFSPTRATAWCGDGEAVANRPNTDLSSPDLVHVVYAIPADGTDRFSTFAPLIAADLGALDAWWRGQDPTRTPRFDYAAFPCATHAGQLDLSVARLPRPASSYMAIDRGIAIANDLAALGPPSVKTLVYYDGPVPSPYVCGTTYARAPQSGGTPFGFAFVWVGSSCPADYGSGGFEAAAAGHELTHNLGAVMSGAPHECPGENAGHVCDSPNDLLYPYGTISTTLATVTLDVGRNDYYGHSGSWWDVQDSPWLAHLPQFGLTLSTSGGPGSVELRAPGGSVSCPPSCTEPLDNGTRIELTAVPGAGERLVSWAGSCSGAAPTCQVTMDAAKSAEAVFGEGTFAVQVRVSGKGKVTSTPSGISCPARCSARFDAGTSVVLRARPAKRSRFAGWSALCRGRRLCTVTAARSGTVRATFRRKHA